MTAHNAPRLARRKARHTGLRLSAALVVALSLTACKSSEEQAEEYYESAVALAAEGDTDRAMVQLRNVFNEDGTHYEARRMLADIHLEAGRPRDAYSQYLRLAEQYPDDLPTRIALARLATETGQKDEFERHANRAQELAPDDPDVQAIALSQRYVNLTDDSPAEERAALADQAEAMVEDRPDDVLLLTILLDRAARDRDLDRAGQLIDRLMELQPDNPQRYAQRLAWLSERGDMAGIETHLRATLDRFPDSTDAKGNLLAFYVSENRTEDAEAFLREMADAAAEGDATPQLDLIRYIEMTRGSDAARQEMRTMLEQGGDPLIFGALLAGADYVDGNRDEAIAQVQGLLADREPAPETRNLRIQLARMLAGAGREDEARPLVAEVLAEEPGHVGALKMQAGWNIEADQLDDAILALRAALDSDAEDVEALSLMADAYYRAGEPDLMRDFLARAAEASDHAPTETLRFAQSLLAEGRTRPAEDALLPALQADSENVALLAMLGRTYLAMPDLPRAQGVVARLKNLDTPQSNRAAQELELAQLSREEGRDAAIDYLRDRADAGDATIEAQVELLYSRIAAGDLEGARIQLETLRESAPDNRMVRQADAQLAAATGQPDAARQILDRLIEDDPSDPAPHLMRLRLIAQSGDNAEALEAVDASLEQLPEDPDLLWTKAGLLERAGRIDEAIAIFETLYDRSSDAVIVANNLASLLATYHADDPERLAQATSVARRLAGTTVPAFMDTYGWLLHLNGDSEGALPYLEGAAEALENDPAVQLHLGIVRASLGQTEEARDLLTRGLEMADDLQGSTAATARATLEGLQSPADAQAAGANDTETN
ncbi:tetratricopeptide repeat protein [Paracoccus sp. 1_MG-2023]|uniref:tetratricopeptide repeat protein n=1 Tax=unclassified Paracoccus (in: a-proteobacteria) TaxID=2688777 RepID=UPI001C099A1E|nr:MULTISPECIES: tetratricopeptide repeat protein [unclassified Paracoccus (in: a-proteobacteria)]MBU2958952.1 tetratricopeptide repeat protein [Paracoccus sp. C2R09]MDO6669957.1 tetratricopeptide repeat protein [Paracoccus sp. 1_MG-2023]